MSDVIKLLPDAIANQIAAGEVVQRPASAVKELLENAIDAGSKHITLIVKDAGKTLIQVVDDGKGMSETDARMCFERHATSKIEKAEDLYRIKTMGFRGEAMASIAAVSQTELKTRRDDDELGTILRIEGGEYKRQDPIAMNPGTSVLVKNLFYNIPARRNFLKSNAVEMKHIVDEFQRIALAHPDIAFNFFQNDLEVFNLKPSKLAQRIVHLFSKSYQGKLAPCEEHTDLLSIQGYMGAPEAAKKTRGEQFFFINKRFIRNNYLHHAIKMAYNDLIGDDSFPFYVLFIEIDPSHIDVNVHPTKTEVKFDDERTVYGILQAAARKSLGQHNFSPTLDFTRRVELNDIEEDTRNFSFAFQSGHSKLPDFTSDRPLPKTGHLNSQWDKLYEGIESRKDEDRSGSITIQSALNQDQGSNTDIDDSSTPSRDSVFQIHKNFIITQIKSGFIIIHQGNAHERILYEKYLLQMDKKSGSSQQLLFSKTVHFGAADYQMIMSIEKEIRALGFDFRPFGDNTLVINGLPADINSEDERELFEGLIEQFKNNNEDLKLPKKENLARSLAKKSAIRPGKQLGDLEMRNIIDQLFACKIPHYTPDGKPTIMKMELNEFNSYFQNA